jgi:hypothetical protein
MLPTPRPFREVRAHFDDHRVRVYQAYAKEIAIPAVAAGRFVPPFGFDRMTWIKPSFTWMMYRSGWGTKPRQEHVLAIDITRAGFEWALAHASLSSFDPAFHASQEAWKKSLAETPVRIQWDPERTLDLQPLPWRAIPIGLGGEAVRPYVEDWILSIEDISPLVARVRRAVTEGGCASAEAMVPEERPYPLSEAIRASLGCSEGPTP